MLDPIDALKKAYAAIQIEVSACKYQKMEVPQHLKQADDALRQILEPLKQPPVALSQNLYNGIVLQMAQFGCGLFESQKMVLASMVRADPPVVEHKPMTCFDAEKIARRHGIEWTTRLNAMCEDVLKAYGEPSAEDLKAAARYLWLRNESDDLEDVTQSGDWWGLLAGCTGSDFDRMVDESMAAGKLIYFGDESSGLKVSA